MNVFIKEFIFLANTRRLLETAFPGADKCNYIDLANFIRGEEIKLVRYLFYAKARLPSKGSRKK